jgi:hypothetical protein
MHAYILTYKHTYIQTHSHAYTYMHTVLHIHTNTNTFLHTCMHTFIHTYTHTYIHARIHPCTHTYIHARIHPCTHTYIHARIHGDTKARCSYNFLLAQESALGSVAAGRAVPVAAAYNGNQISIYTAANADRCFIVACICLLVQHKTIHLNSQRTLTFTNITSCTVYVDKNISLVWADEHKKEQLIASPLSLSFCHTQERTTHSSSLFTLVLSLAPLLQYTHEPLQMLLSIEQNEKKCFVLHSVDALNIACLLSDGVKSMGWAQNGQEQHGTTSFAVRQLIVYRPCCCWFHNTHLLRLSSRVIPVNFC